MPKFIIDTNCFLDHADILIDYPDVIFSMISLQELDALKNDKIRGYSARAAIKSIRTYVDKNPECILDSHIDESVSNDMNIIMTAKRYNGIVLTKDIGMTLLARALSVEFEIKEDTILEEYSPYIHDTDPGFVFQTNDLEGKQLKEFKNYILWKFDRPLSDWDYYITPEDIFCYNPHKKRLDCISRNRKYCGFNIEEGVDFRPRDIYQKAAVYSIFNADATLLTGSPGTGKSLVSVSCALALAQDRKVYILRPTIESKRYALGHLPGDKNDKLYPYFSGFMSALSTLYGNTRTPKHGMNNVDYDFIKEDLSHKKFEFLTMPELHGLSVQAGDILIADEIQLLDKEYMGLLISRIGEGAKLVLMGDMNQTVNLLKNSESGLNKLLNILPNKAISHVDLKTVYRNKDLCKLADKILK